MSSTDAVFFNAFHLMLVESADTHSRDMEDPWYFLLTIAQYPSYLWYSISIGISVICSQSRYQDASDTLPGSDFGVLRASLYSSSHPHCQLLLSQGTAAFMETTHSAPGSGLRTEVRLTSRKQTLPQGPTLLVLQVKKLRLRDYPY